MLSGERGRESELVRSRSIPTRTATAEVRSQLRNFQQL